MMKKAVSYLLFMLIAFSACRKTEVPEPVHEAPVFFFSGMVDGQQVQLRAGENRDAAFSGIGHTSNIYSYYGGIGSAECQGGCPERIQVVFRDANAPAAGESLNALLDQGNVPFTQWPMNDSSVTYTIHFSTATLGQAVSYQWEFSNGMTSTVKNPVIEVPFDQNVEFLEACVRVNFASGCEILDCDFVYLPHAPCAVDFSHAPATGVSGAVDFVSEVKSKEPVEYHWAFSSGGSASSSEVRYFYILQDSLLIVDTVDLRIETNGCQASHREIVASNSNLVDCVVNFDYHVSTSVVHPPVDTAQSGTVEVTWTDVDGSEYTSSSVMQPATSFFRVDAHSAYSDPHFQSESKSLKTQASFDCYLFGNGKTIRVQDGRITVPVGLGYDGLE